MISYTKSLELLSSPPMDWYSFVGKGVSVTVIGLALVVIVYAVMKPYDEWKAKRERQRHQWFVDHGLEDPLERKR